MSKRQSRGFTLIELIFFIVVVGVGLAGIVSVSTTVVKSSAEPMVRKQALAGRDFAQELFKTHGQHSSEFCQWRYPQSV
jgi:type II secretory pathway pseudopilin PulG